jgi:hypothetical protein
MPQDCRNAKRKVWDLSLALAEIADTMAALLAGRRLDVSDVEPGT